MTASDRPSRLRRVGGLAFFVAGLALLITAVLLLRITMVTDYLYHATVKDPERTAPAGDAIVAPADGTVLYVRRITDGMIPQVIKRGVAVPVVDHLKVEPVRPFKDGYLIGIYMNTQGVHVNRMPNHGTIRRRFVFNGPHMDMSEAESRLILTQMVPGLVTLRKLIGLPPHDIADEADKLQSRLMRQKIGKCQDGKWRVNVSSCKVPSPDDC